MASPTPSGSPSEHADPRLPDGRLSLAAQSPAPALGPLDGRYRRPSAPLTAHLSEAAERRAEVERKLTEGLEP